MNYINILSKIIVNFRLSMADLALQQGVQLNQRRKLSWSNNNWSSGNNLHTASEQNERMRTLQPSKGIKRNKAK